jgi:hypothetical protein
MIKNVQEIVEERLERKFVATLQRMANNLESICPACKFSNLYCENGQWYWTCFLNENKTDIVLECKKFEQFIVELPKIEIETNEIKLL